MANAPQIQFGVIFPVYLECVKGKKNMKEFQQMLEAKVGHPVKESSMTTRAANIRADYLKYIAKVPAEVRTAKGLPDELPSLGGQVGRKKGEGFAAFLDDLSGLNDSPEVDSTDETAQDSTDTEGDSGETV